MSLGEFYKQVEKIIINDLVAYFINVQTEFGGHDANIKILNMYLSDEKHINEFPNVYNMGIGNDPNMFLKTITSYRQSLRYQKFDIINCRFSMKSFANSIKYLLAFIEFIADTLKPNGIFMGFSMDINKLNSVFAEKSVMRSGPYKLEYVSMTPMTETGWNVASDEISNYNLTTYPIIVNDETVNIIDFATLQTICLQYGLVHLENIILESLFNNSLNHIPLKEYEKQFGFLNYVFLFQKK